MKARKGQAAAEFLVFTGLAIALLIIFLIIGLYFIDLSIQRETVQTAEDLARVVKNEINLAAIVENGYTRDVDLPAKLKGDDYYISIGSVPTAEKREIVIRFAGIEVVENLAADISIGIEFLSTSSKTGIKIQKTADQVQISKLI